MAFRPAKTQHVAVHADREDDPISSIGDAQPDILELNLHRRPLMNLKANQPPRAAALGIIVDDN